LVAAYISAAESIATSAAVTTITHRIYEAILHLYPLPHPICADGQAAGRGRNLRRERQYVPPNGPAWTALKRFEGP